MNDQARVLMLSTEYLYTRVGGLGAHVSGIAPRLADRMPLDLVAPRYDGDGPAEESLGRYGRLYRVDALRPHSGGDFDVQVWHMNDRLNEFISERINGGRSYGLIHAHDWLSSFVANDLHKRYQIPLVATIHATEMGRVGGAIRSQALSERIHIAERHFVKFAGKVIACSEFMRDEIVRTLGAEPANVVVIPNGVTVESYLGLHARRTEWSDVRARWAAEGAPVICFVGRLVWEKGPDLLVRAMPEILRTFPDAQLLIAGKGPFAADLKLLVESMRLGESVHMLGFVSDEEKNQLYAVADVAAFPSRYEPFGIVALEAMAAGLPVIVADVGGLREVIEHETTGLCVQSGRVDALAAAVIETLQDRAASDARARHAQSVVLDRFTWDHVAGQTAQVYREMMATPAGSMAYPFEG